MAAEDEAADDFLLSTSQEWLQWYCRWHSLLDQHHRPVLGTLLIFTGVMCCSSVGWLVSGSCVRVCHWSRAQGLLVNTCAAALLRCLLSGFPFVSTSALSGSRSKLKMVSKRRNMFYPEQEAGDDGNRWLFGLVCCRALGFLRHFLGLAELFGLVLQVSERAVHAAGDINPGNKVVIFSAFVCWFLALVWPIFPLFGIGKVSCDLTCVSCGMDWSPLRGVQFWYNTAYMTAAIGLPVAVIYGCLLYIWTSNSPVQTQKHAEEKRTTHAVTTSVMLWMFFNVPSALVTLMIVFRFESSISPVIVILAHISPEVGSSMLVVCFLCLDTSLREALICPTPVSQVQPFAINKIKNRRHKPIPFTNACCCC